jgi:hypothetical protein
MTISEAMVLMKVISNRKSELVSLRNSNSIERRTFYMRDDGAEKQRDEVEPKYDVKKLDKKISELEKDLFKVETAVKRANAKTEIGVEVDIDKILEPIE